MIDGVHALIYSKNAPAIRAFFRDVLGFQAVDAGDGWLIFALPPSEIAMHPTDEDRDACELYLMCRDLDATVRELAAKGVGLARPITEAAWGRVTAIQIAPGSTLGLYQPTHPTAIEIG
jgi:predicted enzyme related to lactoylglutathione lyase